MTICSKIYRLTYYSEVYMNWNGTSL